MFSGSRSDYAHVRPVIREALKLGHECEVIAGGAHVATGTLEQFARDDLPAPYVLQNHPTDTPANLGAACGAWAGQSAQWMADNRPDWLVLHGDRSETLAVATAAHALRVPIAHLEGGDYTAGGTLDDAQRHAITKLAALHLVTNAQSAERVRKMGEEDWRVHVVGQPILHNVNPWPVRKIVAELRIDPKRPIILLIVHPTPDQKLRAIVRGVRAAMVKAGAMTVLVAPNADPGPSWEALKVMATSYWHHNVYNPEHNGCDDGPRLPYRYVNHTLDPDLFAGLLDAFGKRELVGCIAGNSSAGIKEAPYYCAPAVNIGPRQLGRLASSATVHVNEHIRRIRDGILYALGPACIEACRDAVNPYGGHGAATRIIEALSQPLDNITHKRMTY